MTSACNIDLTVHHPCTRSDRGRLRQPAVGDAPRPAEPGVTARHTSVFAKKRLGAVADGHLVALVSDRRSSSWVPAPSSSSDDTEMRLSHETMATSLYLRPRAASRGELIAVPSSGRLRRRPRRCGETRNGQRLGGNHPDHRPPMVVDRAFPGPSSSGNDAQAVYVCLIKLDVELPDECAVR